MKVCRFQYAVCALDLIAFNSMDNMKYSSKCLHFVFTFILSIQLKAIMLGIT